MTFKALISNIDDHPRNHALIAKERDLTPVIAQNSQGIDENIS